MVAIEQREGHVEVPGGRVWYKIAGDGPGVPLLTLHGGPGAGHDYLEPLEVLGDERPVVFYDQLGCGRSDIPDDASLWRIGRFVEEVDAVRGALGLDRVHVLGQSWGGFLAIEYMLTAKPPGVVSLTLASTSASTADFAEGARSLIAGLSESARRTIERCEAEGTTNSPEYQAASFEFIQKHVCRLQPLPDFVIRTVQNIEHTPTYNIMWGPSEFNPTGNLQGWDRNGRLGEIAVPVLITSGLHDEAVPAIAEKMRGLLPNAEAHLFQDSAHMAHAEEAGEFARILRRFLAKTEAAA